jgi:mandelate racemase
MTFNHLTLRSLSGTAVTLPMKRPLGTSAQTIDTASLLLVDLLTAEGITGRAYAFCYLPSIARSLVPIVAQLSGALAGQPLIPLDLTNLITRHFKLPGVVGPLAMVASSVDTAIWDALAIAADMPLARFLGASPRQVPAYNSNGLGLISPDAAADEAEALLENGFRAVKLRLGRGEIGLDLAAVRAVRKRLPDQVRLMVDFNQALTFSDAMQYCLALGGLLDRGAHPARRLSPSGSARAGSKDANPDRRELRRVGTDGRCARSVGVGLCDAGS